MSFVSTSLKSLPVRFGAACISMATILGAPMAHAMVPPSERAVLDAIWFGTGGQLPGGTDSTWINRGGWGLPVFLGISECGSYGVTCVSDLQGQEHVSRIDLYENGLIGQLPPSLSDLPYLEDFDVGYNDISGELPALDGLSKLQHFYAASNHFSGPIPSLATLASLIAINVGGNSLSGAIPSLNGLSDLEIFYAYSNKLSGSIPPLEGLTKLQRIEVAANHLTGSIPALSALSALQFFDASRNELTGTIPSLDGLSSLVGISVGHNQLSGPIPAISALSNLHLFDVGANRLTGLIPAAPPNIIDATLCANRLEITPQPSIDPAWNAATGVTPWWATPFSSNTCDELFNGDFEWLPS